MLENVTLDGSLSIRPASAFTVTVLGANSFAPAEGISADRANTPALAIRLQQGSSLTLSAWGGANAVCCPAASQEYPALWAQKDIALEDGVKAGVSSGSEAVCSASGGIAVDSASLTACSKDAAVFAEGASTGGACPDTSVVLRNSEVSLDTTQGCDAVWAAQGGILVEDSTVDIQTRKDADGGYALYSEGNITIRGAGTRLTASSAYGIGALENMEVEAGALNASAYEGSAFSARAMHISGGQIHAYSAADSALCTTGGTLAVTGEGASATAVSANAKNCCIQLWRQRHLSGCGCQRRKHSGRQAL